MLRPPVRAVMARMLSFIVARALSATRRLTVESFATQNE
jgi:hypothetical protein